VDKAAGPRRIENIIGPLIFGTFFIIIAYAFGEVGTLQCTREGAQAVGCLVQQKWLGILKTGESAIHGAQNATLKEDCDEGCIYDVVVGGTDGTASLLPNYTCGRASREGAVARINEFLRDSKAHSLELTLLSFDMSCPFHVLWAVALVGVAVGLVRYLFAKVRDLFKRMLSALALLRR
jgi:hypothetical protein